MEGKDLWSSDQSFEWKINLPKSVSGGGLGTSFNNFRCAEEGMKLTHLKQVKEAAVARPE